jgi:hypothetical protein
MKQQAERITPAEQGEDVMLRECIIDAESSGNGERVAAPAAIPLWVLFTAGRACGPP